MYTMVGGSQLICTKKKSQHLKIWKRRRRLQPELLNGILSRVQLRGNDANSCEHREAAVVDFALLNMVPFKTCYESSKPETKQNLGQDAISDMLPTLNWGCAFSRAFTYLPRCQMHHIKIIQDQLQTNLIKPSHCS